MGQLRNRIFRIERLRDRTVASLAGRVVGVYSPAMPGVAILRDYLVNSSLNLESLQIIKLESAQSGKKTNELYVLAGIEV